MHPIVIVLVLCVLSAVLMVLERRGLPTTLTLTFKSDVKRETRFLAQYGQLVCAFITALLIWQIDVRHGLRICEAMWVALGISVVAATLLKRSLGRARPRSVHAGRFLGPSFKHANFRESFPSSHSASAFAFSGILAHAYPDAAVTFWTLALICAFLRYVMDAHWPSDVLGGIALGYVAGLIACQVFF